MMQELGERIARAEAEHDRLEMMVGELCEQVGCMDMGEMRCALAHMLERIAVLERKVELIAGR